MGKGSIKKPITGFWALDSHMGGQHVGKVRDVGSKVFFTNTIWELRSNAENSFLANFLNF